LVDRLIARHQIGHGREVLIDRTLSWIAMFLRSRNPSDFAGMSRDVFVVYLLAKAFKLLTADRKGEPPGPPTDKRGEHQLDSTLYQVWSHSLPHGTVGGDWLGVGVEGNDSLWVIAADVTGHGYLASILARGLPHLWGMQSIAELRSRACLPHELLDALNDVLEPVLPDAIFVEATLARFTPAGRVVLAGAGFCRVVLRRAVVGRLDLHHIGGPYLGLGSGTRDQLDWAICVGDEMTMASDGLFEQPDGDSAESRLEVSLVQRTAGHLEAGRTLHDAILAVLGEVLGGCHQHDDITVVTIRHSKETSAGGGTDQVSL
jgi:serine phosphatase RsbU (regulator of sigma subunit)